MPKRITKKDPPPPGLQLTEFDEKGRRWFLQHVSRRGGWINLKIVTQQLGWQNPKQKRNWNLGHNGERFAKGRDFAILQKYYPDLICVIEEALNHDVNP